MRLAPLLLLLLLIVVAMVSVLNDLWLTSVDLWVIHVMTSASAEKHFRWDI
jgi:hypothetical protein